MIKKLLIIFVSGLGLAIIALSSAWVVGGDAVMQKIEHDGSWSWMADDDQHPSGPQTTQQFVWKDTQPLKLEVPVNLHFVHADQFEMTATGPVDVIRSLRFENGRLFMVGNPHVGKTTVNIAMRGPHLSVLEVSAPAKIELRDLKQPRLQLVAKGPTSITAYGDVDDLAVQAGGIGEIDLAGLRAGNASVSLDGVGSIDLNATGAVSVAVNGVGEVNLHERPKALTTHTSGLGRIEQLY